MKKFPGSPILHLLVITILLTISFFLFKAPLKFHPIVFLDDGEILYHAFNIVRDAVPYRDDISHHFLGYTIPIVLWSKFFDLTEYTVRQFALFNQVLTGLGIFLLGRKITSPGWAMIASLLYISAREPFVTGFFIQYEFNLIFVYLLLASYNYILTNRKIFLFLSNLLAGIAFCFDQRAIFYSIIPLWLLLTDRNHTETATRRYFISLLSWMAMPTLCLLYLWHNGALVSFYEQTFIYPSVHRVGSFSFIGIVEQGVLLHKYLFEQSGYLTGLSIIGYFLLVFDRSYGEHLSSRFRWLLAIIPLPLFLTSALGSRDYDYYTLVWLPYLALMTSMISIFLARQNVVRQAIFGVTVLICLIPPYIHSFFLSKLPILAEPFSDGTDETVEFIRQDSNPSDSIFVWGYRMDLYVRLGILSSSPFTSQIMIHPDRKIKGADREAHVYTPYLQKFLNQLKSSPPKYLILVGDRNQEQTQSTADDEVKKLLKDRYERVFEIERETVLRNILYYEVYRLKT